MTGELTTGTDKVAELHAMSDKLTSAANQSAHGA